MPSPRMTEAAIAQEVRRLRQDVDSMAVEVTSIKSALQRGEQRFDTIERKVDEGNEATKELVEAWKMGTGLVRFMKWLSGFAVALAALWALIRAGWDRAL